MMNFPIASKFKRGDKVILSNYALDSHMDRNRNRIGIVVGCSRTSYGSCFRIKWENTKIPQTLHQHFLKKVKRDD